MYVYVFVSISRLHHQEINLIIIICGNSNKSNQTKLEMLKVGYLYVKELSTDLW